MSEQIKITTFADLMERGVLEIGDGYRAKLEELGGDGPFFLRAGLLNEQGFDWASAERFRSDVFSKISSKLGQPGDTMVTTKGNGVGRTAYVPLGTPEFVYSPHLSYWRSVDFSQLSSKFIRYWSKSSEFSAQLESMAHGTDMAPYLSLADQRRLRISLPPIFTQEVIAEVLGSLDSKVAVNEDISRTSRELMRAKYTHAIGYGVESVTIDSIADVFDGPHATPKKTESGPWFLSISSLCNGRLVLEESAHLAEPDLEKWTRRVTPTAGDVLFSYETRLGEAALMPSEIRACLGRRMALMRPHDVGPRTLLQAFLSPSFQETIKQYSVHGATVDRILLSEFPSWHIDLPNQEPQHLEYVLRDLDELAEQRERENETLAKIRDALLPKLMSGEVRVRDAEKVVEEVT